MYSLNYKKISIISVCVIIFGVIFGYVIFPKTLHHMISSQLQLRPGSQIRSLYTKVPFAIDFRMYIFNVTNKDEVINGGKPKLQEIGPYYFEEWKEKFDFDDDDEEDSFTFNYKNTFIFRSDLSNGLTGNEIITVPHLFIWSMVLGVNVDKKPMLPTILDAINELFHHPTESFWTGRAMDLFFDGILVDCSSQAFAAQAICSMFATGDVKIVKVDDVTYKFSIFGAVNGTGLGKFKVHRGINNIHDLGRVITFNDDTEMDTWDGDECNQYKGTDSTIFPPFLSKEEGLWAYEPSMCRALGAVYEKPSSYAGIPTWRYTLDFGDTQADPKLHCFCMDPPHNCPRKGTYELFKCVGVPLVASMPHFYNADPTLLDKIASGLNPNHKDHAIYLDFVSLSGSPISAAKRLQFNIEVVPVKEIPIMSGLQEMIMPLFWVEEAASINQTYIDQMKQLFTIIKLNSAIKYLCITLGSTGAIISTFLYFKQQGSSISDIVGGDGGKKNIKKIESWMKGSKTIDKVDKNEKNIKTNTVDNISENVETI